MQFDSASYSMGTQMKSLILFRDARQLKRDNREISLRGLCEKLSNEKTYNILKLKKFFFSQQQ